MRIFTDQQLVTAVKRQVYTGSKSTYTVVSGLTFSAYLRPLSEELSAVNGIQWGQGFQMITEVGIDVRVGDRVTVSAIDYTIRGMAIHKRGSASRITDYQKFVLVKTEV